MKQFLIIQLARFGDIVQTKRLVKSLERCGQVHLCIDRSLRQLAVLVYPQAILHVVPAHVVSDGESAEQVRMLYNTLQALRDVDFCAVYNLNFSPLNTALVRIFDPEIVIGYAVEQGQVVRSALVHKAFRWTQNRQISPINLADYWAYFHDNPCPPHMVNVQAVGQGRGIGVVLAGRESRRSLPMPVLAQVLRTYFEAMNCGKSGIKIYLFGSNAEVLLARQLRRLLPATMQRVLVDLSGKTTWSDLVQALTGLDILLSPDTGTMHLAAHLGVPVVAFFLSSAWCHETGPYGEGHFVWQSVATCAPCLESAQCLIDTKCLDDFTNREFYRIVTVHIQGNIHSTHSGLTEFALKGCTLTGQKSCLDDLGSAWEIVYGEDKQAQRRAQLRAVLADYCGLNRHVAHGHLQYNTEMIQYFYEEADWMLRAQSQRNFACFEPILEDK